MTEKYNDLIEKYGDSMFRCAFAYCQNRQDAEDVVQEVFGKLLNKQPDFKDENHEKAWLLRVTINTSKNHLRSFWRRKVELTDEEIIIYEENDKNERVSEIWALVNELPEKYRIVIELYFVENLSIKEIAKILNKNVSTIGTQFERAKNILRKRIEEMEKK